MGKSSPSLVIELDDRTHDADKDARGDDMLKSAGYRTIRWHSKTNLDVAAIRAQLFPPAPAPIAQAASGAPARKPA